jgi:pimeloyl-ACP methyl ester carboxylesterase
MQYEDSSFHGISAGTPTRGLALHVHGTWGNFYENPFVTALAPTYVEAGYAYASTNNPGHDGGSIDEDFDQSLGCIAEWVAKLGDSTTSLVLQGHSLGALKLLRLFSTESYKSLTDRVKGLVLLSPFDMVAFNGGKSPAEIDTNRSTVLAAEASDGGSALVSKTVFDVWPISIGTWLQASEPDGPWDVFPTRNGSIGLLAELTIPTLVFVGEADFASFPSGAAVIKDLEGSASPNVRAHLIPEGVHNFAGREAMLSTHLRDFLQEVSG